MLLTNRERELVKESFLRVAAQIDEAARLFYDRLFETAPEIASLFKQTNMQAQGRVLMQMLDRVVESLDRTEAVQAEMQQLGKRHTSYGIQAEHYAPFGEALIWMIQQRLGREFTPEMAAAWGKAFRALSDFATQSSVSDEK